MRKLALLSAVALMGAVLTLGSANVYAEPMGFDRLIYGDDLYGLPNIATSPVAEARTWDKIDFGGDLYGLPNVASAYPAKEMLWDKLDYGDDLYGLPNIVTVDTTGSTGKM